MILRALTIITLVLLSTIGYAQMVRTEVDSLENLVKTVPADTTRVWLLNKLVGSLREYDNRRALRYAQEARELAQVINYTSGLALALEHLGWINYRLGDYSAAFETSTEALRLAEELKDPAAVARCLNTIAAVNSEQGQFDLSISNFQKAYRVALQAGNAFLMARSLNNVAYTYFRTGRVDSAHHYAKQALEAGERSHNNYVTGFAWRTLGDVAAARQKTEDALGMYNQAMAAAEHEANTFLKASTLHRMANAYKELKRFDKAIDCLLQNVSLTRYYGYRDELEQSYKLLADVYAIRHDTISAFNYQRKYIVLHDSTDTRKNNEQMAVLQARFESEMKEAQIGLLTKDAQLKQEEISSQRVWLYFYIGCLSLLAVLAFVLFYNNRHKQRANLELEVKNAEIAQQARQLQDLNRAKDKLFSIMSHDLRSPLMSLRGLIDLLSTQDLSADDFMTASRKLDQNLNSVIEDLDNILLWVQSQLKGLRINAEPLNFREVLDEKILLFREQARSKNISIINEVEEDLSVVADRNHLRLILRNLLVNAIKFNQPGGLIIVRQQTQEDWVEISVKDSGIGMEPADVKKLFRAETHFTSLGTRHEKGAGIGLLLAKEFVEKNGGAIWVTSERGQGATFTFTLKRNLVLENQVTA